MVAVGRSRSSRRRTSAAPGASTAPSEQVCTTLGDTSVRFDWAHPVGTYKDTNVGPNTFYVQLLQTF